MREKLALLEGKLGKEGEEDAGMPGCVGGCDGAPL